MNTEGKMARIKQISSDLEQGPVGIRALNSLSRPHVEAVVAVAGDGWAVQTTDDYNSYLSIIVEASEHASDRPAYLISGTVQQHARSEPGFSRLRHHLSGRRCVAGSASARIPPVPDAARSRRGASPP